MPQRVPRGLLAATALSALTAGAAMAEKVTLKTLDQSFSVEGEIVEFDGENYTISTSIGNITVNAGLVVCEGDSCPNAEPETGEFVIAGDKTLGLRLMPALLRNFGNDKGATTLTSAADNAQMVMRVAGGELTGEATVTIRPTNSSDGLDALFKGEAQLALTTRAIRTREARAFEEFGLGQLRDNSQETIVALDGLVFVNHPENPVRSISESEAAQIFAGEITNWAELGGRDEPINLYIRETASVPAEALDSLIMRPGGFAVSQDATVYDADHAIEDAVLNDLNGIGFTSFTGAGAAQMLSVRGECGLQIPPTEFSIKTEEYPLTRLLYMYQTNARLPANARDFRDYLSSDEAQSLVAASGFVDLGVTLESSNAQGLRIVSAVLANRTEEEIPLLLEMVELFAAADRMSTTFRFETGTADLNARSQGDVGRLAELLATDRFTNKEILFVGFTDSVGDAELNRLLSQQRAEQVLETVLEANPAIASNVRVRAVGFGEISPLGCNETNTGRLTNRRVEVWVRDIVDPGRG